MFLNGLKTKSIIRKLKNEVASRTYVPSGTPIRSIGILQEEAVPFDKKNREQLAKVLGIQEKDIEILTYVTTLSKDQKEVEGTYSVKSIGWNGIAKTASLKTFIAKDFDILLSYYTEDRLPLRWVSGLSKAVFKVGLIKEEESLHDLVITTATGEETVFINELEKYLRILKIL